MSFLRLYARVFLLLGPEAKLGAFLAGANILLAIAQFAEPVLFGRIVDALVQAQTGDRAPTMSDLLPLLGAWVAFGLFTHRFGRRRSRSTPTASRIGGGSPSSPATSSTCCTCRSPITAARIPAV